MLGILICVVLWELLKWGTLATSRRARRLARIQAQTYEEIQRELQRFQERRLRVGAGAGTADLQEEKDS